MSEFIRLKKEYKFFCSGSQWKNNLELAINAESKALVLVNPLLALLLRPELRYQAAFGLGLALQKSAAADMDGAKNIFRRLMWMLNEESGNTAWGVPEAMGCILADVPKLSAEYSKILLSYVHFTGTHDNYIEHTPLRFGAYWGIGRLCASDAAVVNKALPLLLDALVKEEFSLQGMASWAISCALSNSHVQLGESAGPGIWNEKLLKAQETLALLTSGLDLRNTSETLLPASPLNRQSSHEHGGTIYLLDGDSLEELPICDIFLKTNTLLTETISVLCR